MCSLSATKGLVPLIILLVDEYAISINGIAKIKITDILAERIKKGGDIEVSAELVK